MRSYHFFAGCLALTVFGNLSASEPHLSEFSGLVHSALSEFASGASLSQEEKRNQLQALLEAQLENSSLSFLEKPFLEKCIPPLAYVIFPDQEETIPSSPSPSEGELESLIQGLKDKHGETLSLAKIGSCVADVLQITSLYPNLSSGDKAGFAKTILQRIIAIPTTPFIDTFIDPLLERIGFALIDFYFTEGGGT